MSKFKQLTNKLISKNPKISMNSADALAAFIGRKKYGPKRFARLTAAGRKKGTINTQTLILIILILLLATMLPVWPYSLHFTIIPSLIILIIILILLLSPR